MPAAAPRPSRRRKATTRKRSWLAPPDERWAILDGPTTGPGLYYRGVEEIGRTVEGGQIVLTARAGQSAVHGFDDVFGVVVYPPR